VAVLANIEGWTPPHALSIKSITRGVQKIKASRGCTVLCPKCKTEHAHRAHRKGLAEHVAGIVGRYPYRCTGCGHRFVGFSYNPLAATIKELTPTEKEIKVTRSAARRKRTLREMVVFSLALVLFLAFLYFITRVRPASEGAVPSERISTPRNTINPAILVVPGIRRYASEIRTAPHLAPVANRVTD
jgi:hypothetical protein